MATLAVGVPSSAQQSQDTFWANTATNPTFDPALGEFAVNLGGHAPFSVLDSSHYFGGTAGLRTAVEDHFLDLSWLDSNLVPSGQVLPPDWQFVNYYQWPAWWGPMLDVWEFRINQGYAQFVRRADKPGDATVDVMYEHLPSHGRDFGAVGFNGSKPFNFSWYQWQPLNLTPTEQVVDAGDIYCLVTENHGGDIWIALQRNQESDWFLRNMTNAFGPGTSSAPNILKRDAQGNYLEGLGRSYVTGFSFGAAVTQVLGLLQPNMFSGAGATFGADYGTDFYSVGDWSRFVEYAEYGLAPPAVTVEMGEDRNFTATMHLMVDLLDIRFDASGPFVRSNWDLAAFSALRRPLDVQVPMQGWYGGSDHLTNHHWRSLLEAKNPLYQTGIYKNAVHEGAGATKGGENEYFVFRNTEWADLKAAGAGPASSPSSLFPPGTPPGPVDVIGGSAYPAPYGHTLRHSCAGAVNGALLTEIDLIDTDTSNTVQSLGQGVGIGRGDSLAIADFDNDGRKEAIFGNFDGYLHVVELPYLPTLLQTHLKDEWKSDRLGWGLWAMAQKGSTLTFGNQQGELFQFQATGVDDYSVAPVVTPPVTTTYDGAMRMLFRGNFDAGKAGSEYLILNHHKDWVVHNVNFPLTPTVIRRTNQAVGLGRGCVVTTLPSGADGTDAEQELVIPALDGHVWMIDRRSVFPFDLYMEELIPYDHFVSWSPNQVPLAWSRAVAIDPNEDGEPEQLLLFGRNDSLATGQTERVALYDLSLMAFVTDAPTQVPLRGDPAFTWIVRPTMTGSASFAIGADNTIEAFDLATASISTRAVVALPTVIDPEEAGMIPRGGVMALGSWTMPTEPVTRHLVALAGNGRIWTLDDTLTWVRDSLDEDPYLAPGTELPWPANRTMAWEYAADGHEDGAGGIQLYVADFQQRFQDVSGSPVYRIEGLALDAANNVTFTPDYPLVPSFPENAPSRHKRDVQSAMNRFLRYDGPGSSVYTAAETGLFYVDPDPQVGPRVFCNVALDPDLRTGLSGKAQALGGYLFEMIDVVNPDYKVFAGFATSPDPYYFVNATNTGDWSFPTVGAIRPGKVSGLSPQLDSQAQGTYGGGTSMVRARLMGSDPGSPVDCVVTGTMGGHLYAAEIPARSKISGESILVPLFPSSTDPVFYESPDLGWYPIGLAAGNLDGDPEDEIVVGTMVDTGTYDDWLVSNTAKNRGHLTILDPDDSTRTLDKSLEIDASDLVNPDQWITSGVFGVALDDVDGDGDLEIWCGDGAGHLFLFEQSGTSWTTRYRSDCLSPFMGAYNRIHPVKGLHDGIVKTLKVMVMSAGYVHAFAIDHNQW